MKHVRSIASLAAAAGFGLAGVVALTPGTMPALASYVGIGCPIKGNISLDSGERIYHVPGQAHYDDTRISIEFGERYFCTEDDARRAGWRRSRL